LDERTSYLAVAETLIGTQARDEAQKTEISLLKIRVATLTEAQDDNCDVEQDSLDAFEGIGPGLGSEAVPHATLFSLGDSDDVDLFRRIYHFSPTEIQQIRKFLDESPISDLIIPCR